MKLSNFRGPFKVKSSVTGLIHDVYDAQGEHVAILTAPDDNTHGVKFGKDHAELLGKSFELLECAVEVNEVANRTDLSADDRLEAIRKLCARFI